MSKFILFSLLWWITGSPFLAILLLLIIFYLIDRRYVGIFPSITRPIQRARRMARLKEELRLNPHHTGNKLELARIYLEKRQYQEALSYLQEVYEKMEDAPEILYELGLCHLKTGEIEKGEKMILDALRGNPHVKYGEPYLELVDVFSKRNTEKAFYYLQQIRAIHSSSVETYYRLGNLYITMGQRSEAKAAFVEAGEIYRGLPKYMRRKQRKWAWLSSLKKLFS
ncbi:tetratricopeptide repeat protein [Ammoniphilus resinae]|uniref:Tetratricopeptide (TPR) repeat protein n=1 Tax=Ammoniphilus resinae TaxID=861532 RepID=A0ABS4GMG0_9BACL|nr:tetratricopeptide repeat protein [Ammoniphilus resinae]MBP1931434.1 tetratricopeptide (TPR) repeat protein [Ammoniphilus resinae]